MSTLDAQEIPVSSVVSAMRESYGEALKLKNKIR